MARKKSSGGEQGGNWMDTYGDMVTLLLTFFVMLYASSSIDAEKWQAIVQAFASKGDIINEAVAEPNEDSESENPYVVDSDYVDGELPETFDQLYQYLVNYVNKNSLSDKVEITKGATNIYLKFRDNIFFDGDSDVLLTEGQEVLDKMSIGINNVEDKILGIKVTGHTAESEFSVADDFTLASGRAVSVVNYLKDIDTVEGDKLRTEGFGQYRPVAPNDTEENKSKNRRVEIIIIRNDVDFSDPIVIDEFLKMEFGTDYVTPDNFLSSEDNEDTSSDTTENVDIDNGTKEDTSEDN